MQYTGGEKVPTESALEQEQEDLLSELVEAWRRVPREHRFEFRAFGTMENALYIIVHPGLGSRELRALPTEIKILADMGLVKLRYDQGRDLAFAVTQKGFEYYEYLKHRTGEPIQTVEKEIRVYLDNDHFRRNYSNAYSKWIEAATLLWRDDSDQRLTTIGHLCREAMQEFATALVERYRPPNVDSDKKHDVARIRAVLQLRADRLGDKERRFLEALVTYWRTVSDLVQRQEHGAQKEGEPLAWEDGRRVVFQAIVVMFEVDRALSRS